MAEPMETCGVANKYLDELYHTTHIREARRVLVDGHIKPRESADSQIEGKDLPVVWTTANDWDRSPFGTVTFKIRAGKMLDDHHIYSLRAPKRRPKRLRFLVTDEPFPGELVKLDPSRPTQPLFRDSAGRWHRPSPRHTINYELMLRCTVSLTDCEGLTFVKHDRNLCKTGGVGCDKRDSTATKAAETIAAWVLASGDEQASRLLQTESGCVDSHLTTGLWKISREVCRGARNKAETAVAVSVDGIDDLLRAGLLALADGYGDVAGSCFQAIGCPERAAQALLQRIERVFGAPFREEIEPLIG